MKIKRFFSQDMRTTIRLVREELGADAVILSNNRVNGGVEIIAAVDYDESLIDQEKPSLPQVEVSGRPPERSRAQLKTAYTPEPQFHELGDSAPANRRDSKHKAGGLNPNASVLTRLAEHSEQENLYYRKSVPSNELPGAVEPDSQHAQLAESLSSDMSNPFTSPGMAKDDEDDNFSFLHLDDIQKDDNRISSTLYDPERGFYQAPVEAKTKPESKKAKPADKNVWSQEPTLITMRNEITTLRSLLESQLTGLAWGDVARKHPLRAKLIRQLLELDISPELTVELANAVSTEEDYEVAWQKVLTILSEQLPTVDRDLVIDGGVFVLVGSTGVGKTTSIAKLAARYALRSGRRNLALVTTDSYRIGAHEQLRTYGRILGIPVRVAKSKEELVETIKGFSDKDLVLVDSTGMSQRDQRLLEQFNLIRDCAPSVTTLLVLSANTHRAGLDESVNAFSNLPVDGCILTKLDETTNLGGALSVLVQSRLPVAYICDGQKVPEDIHVARAHTIVNRSVLIARQTNHTIADEALELAYSRMQAHAPIRN
jgi:flagellar biosynthesis protein FlhF